jgi:chromosome partitioning protein
MRSILVLNSKGGSGKTTLATNLAVFYALRRQSVALVDCDPQASSYDWLQERTELRAAIKPVVGWEGRVRIGNDVDVAIIDAPAAVHGKALAELVKRAQTVLMPVLPTALDMRAALRFHKEIADLSRVHNRQVKIATVANRVREISPSRWELEDFLRAMKLPDGRRLPFIACLRNSQNYVRAAARGLGIAEIAPSAVAHDLELWRPLLRWLNGKHSLPD